MIILHPIDTIYGNSDDKTHLFDFDEDTSVCFLPFVLLFAIEPCIVCLELLKIIVIVVDYFSLFSISVDVFTSYIIFLVNKKRRKK